MIAPIVIADVFIPGTGTFENHRVQNSDGTRRFWPDEATAREAIKALDPRWLPTFFTIEAIDLHDYWLALDRADWWYSMADDNAAYSRGAASVARVESQALLSPAHNRMYLAFKRHYSLPPDTRDEKAPKPSRPEASAPAAPG